jgi:sporulation protein YlmC with PRC-barrel domain
MFFARFVNVTTVAAMAWLLASPLSGQTASDPQERQPQEKSRTDQTDPTAQPSSEPRRMNQPGRIEKASDLLDKELRSTSGEKLGDIEDLIVNPETGKVAFVVASFDKAGLDDKWRAIPCGAVDLPDHGRFFATNVDRERLRNAPSFTSNQWPTLTDVNWNRNVYTYYGETPYWEREHRHMTESERENRPRESTGGVPTSLRAQKVTDLMKKNVKNPQNENLGDIKDFAIDPDAGRVAYGVVAFGGFLGMGEKWFAVPMRSLNLSGNAEHFIMNTDKEQLKKAEGFDKDNWPNMADRTWASRTHTHYNQRPYWEED